IDSSPHNGTAQAAAFAGELCRQFGLHVELQEGVVRGVNQANLIARPQEGRPGEEVLLQSHLDTVDPGSYSLWTETDRNPFNATIKGGKIYGLGAADVKLDFLCKLYAIKGIGKRAWKVPFVLVGTYGEEIGMWGAKHLMLEKQVSAKMALLGEPSEMQIVYASNGIAVVDVHIPFSAEEKAYRQDHETRESTSSHSRIFRGKAAHSSTPQLGDNAILKLIQYLDQLPQGIALIGVDGGTSHNVVPDQAVLEVDMSRSFKDSVARKLIQVVHELENISTEFLNYPATGFEPTCPTFNVGLVRSDDDGVQITFSIRITPSVSREILSGWLNRLREYCKSLGAYVKVGNFKAPTNTSLASPLIKSCMDEIKRLGRSPMLSTKSASNEASIYSPRGIECVVVGPGRSIGNSHCPNEQNSLEELEFAIQFYKGMIERLCA
ncbi:MAG TPA: M20/M25/M40 family metallo-hydrolase, partial [Bdellovibrionales bacterium]|nr:M20/M25/M40 family metallo-hydrolase [Bdellovibrionales bacterium]